MNTKNRLAYVVFVCLIITLINIMCSTNVEKSLTFFTWNMRANFSISKPYLAKYAYGCDFVCLNDHGLYESELYKVEDLYSDYTCLAKSSKHLQAINLGNKRGIGGCALLWKKSLDCSIKPLPGKGTDRICVVQLTIDSREYFIIGVYLPHQNCKIDNFKYELNILNDLCIEFNARGSTFLMGDTNCHFGAAYSNRSIGITTYHAGLFGNMLDACNMRAVDLSDIRTGPNYTWMSDNGSFTSYIDHMTVSEALMPYVTACKIIEDDILNVSDHLALKCSLKIRYTSVIANSEPKTAWHRATASDIALLYTQPLEEKIEVLLNDFNIEGETTVCWNGFERYQNIDIESVIRKLSRNCWISRIYSLNQNTKNV